MKQLVLKYRKYFVFFLFLSLVSPSCDKIIDSPIPDVYVSFTVNLNIVNELNVSGNSVYFPTYGFGGVIVYCEYPGSYYAFDAACTDEISRDCIVQNDGITAEYPCCGSIFVLMGGSDILKGPATLPLKQYRVSIVNNFTFRVYN